MRRKTRGAVMAVSTWDKQRNSIRAGTSGVHETGMPTAGRTCEAPPVGAASGWYAGGSFLGGRGGRRHAAAEIRYIRRRRERRGSTIGNGYGHTYPAGVS